MIDWTDTTLRPLDELARIAFPTESGVTADTLKRRARQHKLTVYQPGKVYLSTLADVWQMIQETKPSQARGRTKQSATTEVAGLTESDLAAAALDLLLAELRDRQ